MKRIQRILESGSGQSYKTKSSRERNLRFGKRSSVSEIYPTEDSFLTAVFQARYSKTPHGCPNCQRPYASFRRVSGKKEFRCYCGERVRPLVGTHLEQSRTDLKTFPIFFHEYFSRKDTGTPATFITRTIDEAGAEDSNWSNMHITSDWIGWTLRQKKFTKGSSIEIDMVYPKCMMGLGPYFKRKRGPASESTAAVLVIKERKDNEIGAIGLCLAFVVNKNDKKRIIDIILKTIDADDNHYIITDEGTEFLKLSKYYKYYTNVNHHKKEYVRKGDAKIHSNSVEGVNQLIKTSLHRCHRTVWPEYLQLYLNRFAFSATYWDRSFYEAFQILMDSLPSLDSKVIRTFKRRERIRDFTKQAA